MKKPAAKTSRYTRTPPDTIPSGFKMFLAFLRDKKPYTAASIMTVLFNLIVALPIWSYFGGDTDVINSYTVKVTNQKDTIANLQDQISKLKLVNQTLQVQVEAKDQVIQYITKYQAQITQSYHAQTTAQQTYQQPVTTQPQQQVTQVQQTYQSTNNTQTPPVQTNQPTAQLQRYQVPVISQSNTSVPVVNHSSISPTQQSIPTQANTTSASTTTTDNRKTSVVSQTSSGENHSLVNYEHITTLGDDDENASKYQKGRLYFNGFDSNGNPKWVRRVSGSIRAG